MNGDFSGIPRGGATALVGPNGAGKSTLLSIIGRLLPAEEGDVRVDGMNVSDTDSDHLPRHGLYAVGLADQQP